MRLASVLLARSMVWIEPGELNLQGKSLYPDFVKALASRYAFHKIPEKIEELDSAKGITFSTGRIGETAILQFVIYTYGLVVDTQTSTERSRQILEEMLGWSTKEFGLTFDPQMMRRWQYTSQLTFYSDVLPSRFPQPLTDLSAKVENAVREITGETHRYEAVSLSWDFDQLTRKYPLGPFIIQRRENTPFSEGKYFAAAPLPTDVHIRLLGDFEKSLA